MKTSELAKARQLALEDIAQLEKRLAEKFAFLDGLSAAEEIFTKRARASNGPKRPRGRPRKPRSDEAAVEDRPTGPDQPRMMTERRANLPLRIALCEEGNKC